MKERKVISPLSDLYWINVFEPREDLSGRKKYSATAIFSKDDLKGYEDIMNALRETYEKGRDKLKDEKGRIPAFEELRLPIRDGDAEKPGHPAYENSWFISAKGDFQPAVVDADCRSIDDPFELYNGIRGRLSFHFFCYAFGENRGIACCLHGLQKLEDIPGGRGRGGTGEEFRDGFIFDEPAGQTEFPF